MAQVTSENARPASVTAADITSNSSSDSVSLVNGLVRLQYFESILQDSIKATVIYSDAGDSINGQSVIEGLRLVGTEDFELALNRLSLEEVIGLKLELASKMFGGKCYGIPIFKSMRDIVNDAVLKYALSSCRTKKEAARFLGLSSQNFNKLLKKYNTESFFKKI